MEGNKLYRRRKAVTESTSEINEGKKMVVISYLKNLDSIIVSLSKNPSAARTYKGGNMQRGRTEEQSP